MRVCSKALQSCLILCNSMDCSPAGSSLHEILQARVLVWAAMPFSKESANPVIKATSLICLLHRQLGSLPLMPPVCAQSLQSCLTLYDPVDSSPTGSLSMELSWQGYWSGLPYPPPGDLPKPEIEPSSPVFPA